jgi:hypothetical protein
MSGSTILKALLLVTLASTTACGPSSACKCDGGDVNASIWGADDGTLLVFGYTAADMGFVRTSAGAGFVEGDLFELPLWRGWGSSASDYFVLGGSVGSASVAHRTPQRMQVWGQSGASAPVNSALSLWGTSSDSVFVVGSGGAIATFDGVDWTARDNAVKEDLRDVWGSAADDVFAVGRHGTLLHFDGVEWAPFESPTTADLNAVWGSSAEDVFVVGETEAEQSHVILHYDGQSWSVVHEGAGGLLGIHGSAPDRVVAVGGARQGDSVHAVILTFDGSEWTEVSSSAGTFLWDVWVAADGQRYTVVGPRQTLENQAF